jgi:hypothetical protein
MKETAEFPKTLFLGEQQWNAVQRPYQASMGSIRFSKNTAVQQHLDELFGNARPTYPKSRLMKEPDSL